LGRRGGGSASDAVGPSALMAALRPYSLAAARGMGSAAGAL